MLTKNIFLCRSLGIGIISALVFSVMAAQAAESYIYSCKASFPKKWDRR